MFNLFTNFVLIIISPNIFFLISQKKKKSFLTKLYLADSFKIWFMKLKRLKICERGKVKMGQLANKCLWYYTLLILSFVDGYFFYTEFFFKLG